MNQGQNQQKHKIENLIQKYLTHNRYDAIKSDIIREEYKNKNISKNSSYILIDKIFNYKKH